MAILFTSGVNDRSTVSVQADSEGKMYPLLQGNYSILGRVPLKKDIPGFITIFGKGVKQPDINFKQLPSLVVNQIADPDTHRGALERCADLIRRIDVPVLNRPDAVLRTRRDEVSNALQGIDGVVVPRTARIRPDSPESVVRLAASEDIEVPFVVRVAENFEQSEKVLIQSEHHLDRLDVFPFDGRDFYVTGFIDCGEESGKYQSQRIAVIDGEPVLRRALFNDQWDVSGDSRRFMLTRESWADDQVRIQWFESEVMPSQSGRIRKITEKLELDYYCIDCNIRPDGELVVFEASAQPDALGQQHPSETEGLKRIHQKIQALLARRSGEVVI